MIRDTIQKLTDTISQDHLMNTMRLVASRHRIQASPGYRETAQDLVAHAQRLGISAEIKRYPMDFGIKYLISPAFPEWECFSASCSLIYPEERMLADFSAIPMSLVQRSFAYNTHQPDDLVLLDRGCDENAYENIDLAGKVVFIREDFTPYLPWVCKKRGAVGFITDYVAEVPGAWCREDMKDVRKYTSFWWYEQPDIQPFGFVLTPEEGDRLAELCWKAAQDGRYPKVRCHVNAHFKPGHIEDVVLTLPGETAEEVWLLAHLCHPYPSSNDNASGVAAALEALRVIKHLTQNGQLPPLRRTVKVILMPEFIGTYAYLSEMESTAHVVGALNLDMVGGRQDKGYGPLTLSGLSLACPSPVFTLAKWILQDVGRDLPGVAPSTRVPGFNSTTVSFTVGSDHTILQDPTIGIPCLMLGQWPDPYYHTSGDTLAGISPYLLAKSTALAACYALILAGDDTTVFVSLLERLLAEYIETTAEYKSTHANQANASGLAIIKKYYQDSADAILRYCPNLWDSVAKIKSAIDDVNQKLNGVFAITSVKEISEPCPARQYRSPINPMAFMEKDSAKVQILEQYYSKWRTHFADAFMAETLIQYHIDGKRSVKEIADMVLLACEGSREAVREFIKTLVAIGLCTMEHTVIRKTNWQ